MSTSGASDNSGPGEHVADTHTKPLCKRSEVPGSQSVGFCSNKHQILFGTSDRTCFAAVQSRKQELGLQCASRGEHSSGWLPVCFIKCISLSLSVAEPQLSFPWEVTKPLVCQRVAIKPQSRGKFCPGQFPAVRSVQTVPKHCICFVTGNSIPQSCLGQLQPWPLPEKKPHWINCEEPGDKHPIHPAPGKHPRIKAVAKPAAVQPSHSCGVWVLRLHQGGHGDVPWGQGKMDRELGG